MRNTNQPPLLLSVLAIFGVACQNANAQSSDADRLGPLQTLMAIEEIKQVKARYFRCMDQKS